MKILLVEDEPKVSAFIKKGLDEQQHDVSVAFDGALGLKLALQNSYDVIILDVILPQINGVDVCRRIRKEDSVTPILLLTALGTTDDKVAGLESGADDYLVKPFQFRELLARVNALGRRKTLHQSSNKLSIEDLTMNLDTKEVRRENTLIKLTAKEFQLLELFLRNKNRVLSRAEIAETIWEQHFEEGSNITDVYVNYLRNKIDKDFPTKLLHTVYGMGYILKSDEN